MIRVIERVFKILEELSMDGEVSLQILAGITGLNKGTLCNILATLIRLGYVRRNCGSKGQDDVGLDLACVRRSVEKPELDRTGPPYIVEVQIVIAITVAAFAVWGIVE